MIEHFATRAEITTLAGHVDQAIGHARAAQAGHRGDAGRGELIWLRNPEEHAIELGDCFAVARARRHAAALLGTPEHAIRVSTRIFAKPARTGSVVPWHQDAGYRPHDPHRTSLNIWIPLDDATVESGCLHFVPGSHLAPVQPHTPYAHDPSGLTLETAPPPAADIVACPVRIGAASAHHCGTLHQSPPNRSDRPRRALVVVCDVDG